MKGQKMAENLRESNIRKEFTMQNNSIKTYTLTRKNGKIETYDENTPLPFNIIEKITGISKSKLYYAKQKNEIDVPSEGIARITIKEALAFDERKKREKKYGKDLCFNINESFKYLPSFPRTHCIMNPRKFRGNTVYAIGNKGTVVNVNRMTIVKPNKAGNGHYQVRLDGLLESFQPTVQSLVSLMWCCNAKRKTGTHHIDGNKLNNNYLNLLPVTDEEHRKAHKILSRIEACRKNGEREDEKKAQEEYLDFINQIKQDNYEEPQDLRIIPHLDYESNDSRNYYMYVTESSYQLYLKSDNVADLEIKGEGSF